MHRTPGQLSADSAWFWDGSQWLPSLSADGAWRWNGSEWTRTGLGVVMPRAAPDKPGVYTWFTVYAIVLAVLYAIVLVFGTVAASGALQDASTPDSQLQIEGIAYMVVSLPLLGLYAAAPLLPRKPWVWIYDLALIAFGFLGCTILVAVPLLIFWIRPEARAFFGRR